MLGCFLVNFERVISFVKHKTVPMGDIFEILELFALQSLFVCTITTLTVLHH